MNPTLDPNLRSWVESANDTDTDFPIQNLPFGLFRRAEDEPAHVGVAIGDFILGVDSPENGLNFLMDQPADFLHALRVRISELLRFDAPRKVPLIPMRDCELLRPVEIGDYTDFYSSLHHATNVGKLFRPDDPLLPNYKYVPVGYHGRASSVVVSRTPIKRPNGQTRPAPSEPPQFGPSRRLDYELELGVFIGHGNTLGGPIPIADAWKHVFGFCLLNDWSARDIQAWEYQPLGPFLSKSFVTSISPWVVTAEALSVFRSPASPRPEGDPVPLSYLYDEDDQKNGGLDIALEVWLDKGNGPVRMSRGSFLDMYWTVAQLVAHHTSNGCNLRTGDLLGSGTVSGPTPDSRGCLLEIGGGFLEDGDTVILKGRCEREGHVSIGFGECVGTITYEGRDL